MAPSISQNIAAIKLAITNVAIILALILSALPVEAQVYVDTDATGANDGSSWTNAYTDLQDALAVATGNDQIWIAEGTYKPGANRGDSFTVTGAQDGLEIYGGFAGGETALSQRDVAAHPAVLSGDIGASGNADNSFHVFFFDGNPGSTITNATILDGVTVTGGNADATSFPNDRGGGLACDGNGAGNECSPVIRNVTFTGNHANFAGGAISNSAGTNGSSSPVITGAIFSGNSAERGGAISNAVAGSGVSHPPITNSTFSGNSAGTGGAIYNDGASPSITNSTFTGNSASDGGAIYNIISSPAITNSILYGNNAPDGDEIFNDEATLTVSYSLVEGGLAGISDHGGFSTTYDASNIDANPLFTDADGEDNTVGTADDDLSLQAGSPAIDAGDNNAVSTSEDIIGNPRIFNGTVDIGAYEFFDPALTLHVDGSGGNDTNDGQSWGQAFATLTQALSAATGNDQIWIAEGTYIAGANRGDSFTVTGAQDGLEIYGGFAGGETALSQRDVAAHPAVLSGDIGTPSDSTDNSRHVLYFDGTVAGGIITNATVLDGVTVTNGNASGGNGSPENKGGGLRCDGSGAGNACSPTIRNVIFSGNSGQSGGGAIFNIGVSGGESSPMITNSTFFGNTAGFGGAILNDGNGGESSPTITNSTFSGNTAQSGGAIHNDGDNNGTSSPTITSSTFSGNTAQSGGAIHNDGNSGESSPMIINTILWGNSANSGDEIYNNSATSTISHTLVEGSGGSSSWDTALGTDGGGNIDANPQFVDATDPDGPDNTFATPDDGLALQAGSPAIDVGQPDTTGLGLPAGDITGGPRILGTAIEMGAYEGPLQVVITGSEGWRMMTAPAGGLSYAALLDTLWLQGIPGGDVTNGFPNLYTWDEQNQVFQPVSNTTNIPAAGQGFIVYVYDDQDFDGTPDGFPKILSLDQGRTGGPVSPALTYTPFTETGAIDTLGFNLVGNPYGVTIDWDNPGWTKTNLSASIYVWDHATGNYLSYNGATGTGGFTEGLITPWQGFWVQATAAGPAIEFTEDVRSTGGVFYGAPGEGPTEPPAPQLRFTLKQEAEAAASVRRLGSPSDGYGKAAAVPVSPRNQRSDGLSSQAVVMFAPEGASAGKDRLDAWKLQSLNADYLSLYTTSSEGYALDINALPLLADSTNASAIEVEMDLDGSSLNGEYTLSWNPQDIPEGWSARMTDLYTGAETNLSQAGEYKFTVENSKKATTKSPPGRGGSGPAGSGVSQPNSGTIPTVVEGKVKNHRFVLRVAPTEETNQQLPAEISISAAYPNPFSQQCNVDLALPETAHVQVVVYDVLGRKITTVVDGEMSASYKTITMDAGAMGVASGVYLCRVKIGDHSETTKMTLIK